VRTRAAEIARVHSLVFSLVAVVQSAPRGQPPAPNVVANAGFEYGTGTPTGWKVANEKDFSMSQQSHSGNWCVALSAPQGGGSTVTHEMRLVPDRTYVLSFWYRTEGGGGMYIRFEGKDPRTETNWAFVYKVPGTYPEWKRVFFLVSPKTPTPRLSFQNYHCKGCTFYVDDVSVDTNLAALVELVEPGANAEPLENNTPTFRWRPAIEPKHLTFDLLYTKSRRFSPRGTTVVSDLLEATEYTPFEPLADGVWYWKLRFTYNSLREGDTASGESDVGMFRVASDKQDHRAPTVGRWGPTRIEDGTAAEITVEYSDNPEGTGVAPENVKLVVDGDEVTAECDISSEKLVFRPDSMSEAVHDAEITLTDLAGNSAVKKWWFLVKPKPERGIAGWDPERKVFLVDGEPFFPFGMYQYRRDQPYEDYRDWGFNTVHIYDGHLPPAAQAASEADLKIFALSVINSGVPEQASFYDETTPLDNHVALPVIAQRVFEVCNEPSLFCWSICDEPDKRPMSRARLKELHDFVKSLDPYHLTDVVLMKYGAYYAYADVADLVVGDVYPYSVWTGNDSPEAIWDEPIHQDRAQGGDRPVLTILQHFGGRQGTSFPHLVPVGMRRFMAYLAYIHGTRGMMWYAFGSSDYGEATDYPEQWEDMKRLAGEFKAMTPILLSDDGTEEVLVRAMTPPGQVDRAGNPAIHYLLKAHDGNRYLLAANAAKEPVQAAFRVGVRVKSVREMHEDRQLDVVRGTGFVDNFDSRGVHVYEIAIRGGDSNRSIGHGPPATNPLSRPTVRTWTDRTGRFHVEATFIDVRNEIAHLRKTDDELLRVPLGQLSNRDQQYIRSRMAADDQ
jgi:hypothetical protein